MTDGNSRLVVPGLESKNLEAVAGKDLELPKTLKLYSSDGTSSDEKVSYTLKDWKRVCSLKRNRRRLGEQCDLVTGDGFSFV